MKPLKGTYERCVAAIHSAMAGAADKRAEDVAIYLAHVEGATSLRRLSKACGKPATTVHRAIRRMEALRDDPLVDLAFEGLGAAARLLLSGDLHNEDPIEGQEPAPFAKEILAFAYRDRVAACALERLAEPEAFLMVAAGAEKAGIFSRRNKFRRPLSLLTIEVAADFAIRDWTRCKTRTSVSSKYVISDAGRVWLRRRLAAAKGATTRDATALPLTTWHAERVTRGVAREISDVEPLRVKLGGSSISWLISRKGPDGAPLLTAEEVEAAERLRADFECAQAERCEGGRIEMKVGPLISRGQLDFALEELGPTLADVALRICCHLEGLEAIEKGMGWSARSAKVVLKIALQQLALHYSRSPKPLLHSNGFTPSIIPAPAADDSHGNPVTAVA